MKPHTRIGWVFAVASFFVASFATAQTVVMRISHQVPPAHHMTKLLEGFAADVKKRTDGQFEVQLFGSEQLAKAAENFRRISGGDTRHHRSRDERELPVGHDHSGDERYPHSLFNGGPGFAGSTPSMTMR